jgi:hypothetical protein
MIYVAHLRKVYCPVQRDALRDLQNHPHRITNGDADLYSGTPCPDPSVGRHYRILYFTVRGFAFPPLLLTERSRSITGCFFLENRLSTCRLTAPTADAC